jgi:IS1 family transposase
MFNHLLLTIVIGIIFIRQLNVLVPLLGSSWLNLFPFVSKQKKPTKKTKHATAPTKRPPCPACQAEQEAEEDEKSIPLEPPPIIKRGKGRPRSVDTSSHFCPRETCDYYGWVGLGNICANGYPNGGHWRQLKCTACGNYFMEAVSAYLIHDLELTQVQVDELWLLLGQRDSNEAGEKQRGERWLWTGMDPESKLMLGYVIGDRSLACAQLLIHIIVAVLAPGCMPVFFSDGWSAYGTALLTHFGHWVETPRRHKRGAIPKPRWLPLPELQYAQVIKKREKGRVVSVSHTVIYGSWAVIKCMLITV